MLTPEEMQAVHPLPAGWSWDHDDEGWLAEDDECDEAVWVSDGQLRSADSGGDTDSVPLDIALAVILANTGRGSLGSIEKDRDDARRSYCEQIADYYSDYSAPVAEIARMLYPGANLYPDQDPPPPTTAKV